MFQKAGERIFFKDLCRYNTISDSLRLGTPVNHFHSLKFQKLRPSPIQSKVSFHTKSVSYCLYYVIYFNKPKNIY